MPEAIVILLCAVLPLVAMAPQPVGPLLGNVLNLQGLDDATNDLPATLGVSLLNGPNNGGNGDNNGGLLNLNYLLGSLTGSNGNSNNNNNNSPRTTPPPTTCKPDNGNGDLLGGLLDDVDGLLQGL